MPGARSCHSSLQLAGGQQSAPLSHSMLSRLELHEQNPDIFRDVIDDLTIQNKKLKRRLEKYEKVQNSQVGESKLFELNVHNLSMHKKRELERLLQNFASSLDNPRPESRHPSEHLESTFHPENLLSPTEKPSPVPLTYNKPMDSAYASMSASGQTVLSLSHRQGSKSRTVGRSRSSFQQLGNFQVHNATDPFAQTQSPIASDISKKRLVVERLEQLFTSKKPNGAAHIDSADFKAISHPEVNAERTESVNATGPRTARMLQYEDFGQSNGFSSNTHEFPAIGERQQETEDPLTHPHMFQEQRPTGPLDLEISQSESATDSMEYIRHLGATSPGSKDCGHSSNEWIYLNLLANMAQLHTLNVTPDFVRHAIIEHSIFLDLSEDGRKVRWQNTFKDTKHELDNTQTNVSGHSNKISAGAFHEIVSRDENQHSQFYQDDLTRKPGQTESTMLNPRRLRCTSNPRQTGKPFYVPLLIHSSSSQEQDEYGSYANEDTSSPTQVGESYDLSFRTDPRVVHPPRRDSHNGPTVYFDNAKFYSDQSKDIVSPVGYDIPYSVRTSAILGHRHISSSRVWKRRQRPKSTRAFMPNVNDDDTNIYSDTPILQIHGHERSSEDNVAAVTPPVADWEASGLGGIRLDDNFAIEVQVRRTSISTQPQIQSELQARPYRHTSIARIRSVCSTHPSRPPKSSTIFKTSVMSNRRQSLPPSQLPPPSYSCFPFSESSDSGSDSDLEDDIVSDKNESMLSAPRLRPVLANPVHGSNSPLGRNNRFSSALSNQLADQSPRCTPHSMSSISGLESDSPGHRRERRSKFESSSIQKLPDLPTGSSAATACGGSGSGVESEAASSMGEPDPDTPDVRK